MNLVYAGIGSRETPAEVLETMTTIARSLALSGYTLRSGGAPGADLAFEKGAGQKEIFLPWKKFNDNPSALFSPSDKALEIASHHHPVWSRLPDSVKRLHGRNAHQILGLDLASPVDFVLCWTQDGCESAKTRTSKTGGTGTAISIAYGLSIPVINLRQQDAMRRLNELIENRR